MVVTVDLVFKNFLNKPFFILIEVLIPEVIHGLDLLFNSCLDNCLTGIRVSMTSDIYYRNYQTYYLVRKHLEVRHLSLLFECQ